MRIMIIINGGSLHVHIIDTHSIIVIHSLRVDDNDGVGPCMSFLNICIRHTNRLRYNGGSAGVAERWKTQGLKSTFTPFEFLEAFFVSLRNIFFVSPILFVALWNGPLRWRARLYENYFDEATKDWKPLFCATEFSTTLILTVASLLLQTIFCVLATDTVFWFTHRLLHEKPFYQAIHKMHHRFHAPTAASCLYTHFFEFLVNNYLGVVLPLAVLNPHPYFAVWYLGYML